MRTIASIFFLSVLLFNWVGYRFVTDYIQEHQNIQLEIQIDNKAYDETSLIEIRVPVSLPYQTDWKEFERVDGEVEFNGMHYKFVERKLQGGEMIYKCLPNEDKAKLLNARESFFKLVNDLETKTPSKKSGSNTHHFYKTFSFDYCEQLTHWKLNQVLFNTNKYTSPIAGTLLSAHITSPDQPPEVFSC